MPSEHRASCMSNYEVHVVANSRVAFDLAVELALSDNHVLAWYEDTEWLVLLWSATPDSSETKKHTVQKLPFEMGPKNRPALLEFLWGWLRSQDEPKAPRPDIEGSVSPNGFEITTKGCHDTGWSYAAFKLRKVWSEAHK